VSQDELVRELSRTIAGRARIIGPGLPPGGQTTAAFLPPRPPGHGGALAAILAGPKPPKTPPAPPKPVEPATEPTRAERQAQAISEVTAQPAQPLHDNPMIADAQRLGKTAGIETYVVGDKTQAIRIWGLGVNEIPASYHPGSDSILINATSKHWNQAELDAVHARGWLATNNPNQHINHEIGHYRHRHNVTKERFDELYHQRKVTIGGPMRGRIQKEVSGYAATSRLEFVAEVHAGLAGGKSYEPSIIGYYKSLGGVIPPAKQSGILLSDAARAKLYAKPPRGQLLSEKVVFEKAKPTRGEMVAARREGTGKDARIVMADGSEAPGHIKPSMVPPNWTDVKVSIDPKAEVLMTGRDEKMRRTTVTTDEYKTRSAVVRFGRVSEMIYKHKDIAKEIQTAQKKLATKEEADVARLMQLQGTRPGSTTDTKAKVKAYGATTLEARHVVQSSDGVRLQFIGKEGVAHDHLVRDKELADMLLSRKNAAASENAPIFNTDDKKVRRFTKTLDGGGFTPKDFRTSLATRMADEEVKNDPRPSANLKEHKQRINVVATKVSRLLGNKPAQALESYIHLDVFTPWKS